ncbi:MAG: stage II sporulation protein R [Mycobacterium leprae]
MRKWIQGIVLVVSGLAMIGAGVFWPVARGQGVTPVAASAPTKETAEDSILGPTQYVRLHVVANSDSEVDQALKRRVRDEILAVTTPLLGNSATAQEAVQRAKAAIPQIEQVARQAIAANGASYPVSVTLGQYDFPAKAYGALYLPAGKYTALRVAIGEAAGANWWCILFPPLCFHDWIGGWVMEPRAGTGGKETEPVRRPHYIPAVSEVDDSSTPVKAEARFFLLDLLTSPQ